MEDSARATAQRKQANRISAKRSRDKFVEDKQKVKAKVDRRSKMFCFFEGCPWSIKNVPDQCLQIIRWH